MIRCDHIAVVVRSAVGVVWGLLEVGEFAEGWGEDEGDDEAACALDDVGGDAGCCCEAVEEIFKAEVAAGDEDDVDHAAADDAGCAAFWQMLQALAGEGCEEGDEAFDEEGGGNVEKVAAEEIGEAAAEASCEKSVEGPEDDAGEDDEGVAGMDVAAGAGGWDADDHGGDAGERGEEGGEDELLGVKFHGNHSFVFIAQ